MTPTEIEMSNARARRIMYLSDAYFAKKLEDRPGLSKYSWKFALPTLTAISGKKHTTVIVSCQPAGGASST
jgi:hypothetical protein